MRAWPLIVLAAAAIGSSAPALAADDDADALTLADKTAVTAQAGRDWHAFVEAAWSQSVLRLVGTTPVTGGPTLRTERLSFDIRYDHAFAPGWRVVFADRVDTRWQNEASPPATSTP